MTVISRLAHERLLNAGRSSRRRSPPPRGSPPAASAASMRIRIVWPANAFRLTLAAVQAASSSLAAPSSCRTTAVVVADNRDAQVVGGRRVRAVREVIAEGQRQVAARRQDDGRGLDRGGPVVEVERARRRSGQAPGHEVVDAAHGRSELLRPARAGRFRIAALPSSSSRGVRPIGICRPAAGWSRNRRRTPRSDLGGGGGGGVPSRAIRISATVEQFWPAGTQSRHADSALDGQVAGRGESEVVGPRGRNMWYAPYAPPLAFVSPCEKATFRSSILAASGAPVASVFHVAAHRNRALEHGEDPRPDQRGFGEGALVGRLELGARLDQKRVGAHLSELPLIMLPFGARLSREPAIAGRLESITASCSIQLEKG